MSRKNEKEDEQESKKYESQKMMEAPNLNENITK